MDGPWLRIGEVARRTGLTQRTLRHYDQLGLLVPGGRSDGDYRLYSRADLERLLEIQHLKSLGLSLAEVAEALDDPGADAATLLARHVARTGIDLDSLRGGFAPGTVIPGETVEDTPGTARPTTDDRVIEGEIEE